MHQYIYVKWIYFNSLTLWLLLLHSFNLKMLFALQLIWLGSPSPSRSAGERTATQMSRSFTMLHYAFFHRLPVKWLYDTKSCNWFVPKWIRIRWSKKLCRTLWNWEYVILCIWSSECINAEKYTCDLVLTEK